MEFMIITLLAVAAIFFTLYPLVTRRKYRFEPEDAFSLGDVRRLNYLNAEKTLVLENIKDLDFEYDMGKLSDEDYASLRSDYLKEAEGILRDIDQLKIREEIEELIEGEVRSRRKIP